jgi:RNA recognition motif-containing protein
MLTGQDNVRVIHDRVTGESRGFAFISFEDVGGVETATECMIKTNVWASS